MVDVFGFSASETDLGSKPIKLFVAVSAFGPIPDIGDVERFISL